MRTQATMPPVRANPPRSPRATRRPQAQEQLQPVAALEFRARRLAPRERRVGSLLHDAVDVQVDMLVVEAEQVLDLGNLRYGCGVAPHDVLHGLATDAGRPVTGHALVRATGGRRS